MIKMNKSPAPVTTMLPAIWIIFLLASGILQFASAQNMGAAEDSTDDRFEECTIGVAAGSATSDGRPLLWKTRDYSSKPNNEIYYNTNYRYKFVSVINAGGSYAWMGVNQKGFAILNSASTDLPKDSVGMGNGSLSRYALGTCANIPDFIHLLDSTNQTGRQTRGNFGVIDSTGGAAIFEVAGHQYWKYDANDPAQAPHGYVIRTNFAFHGGGHGGIERFNRSVSLISSFVAGDSLNYRTVLRHQMRDFSDTLSLPVPVPYPGYWLPGIPLGYIYTYVSICRCTSVSAAVIHGIQPGEKATLSTMWAMLGQPAGAIAVPYWPVGQTPPAANGNSTAPLCDVARQIKSRLFDYQADDDYIDTYKLLDGTGGGLWTHTFPAEDSIFTATDSLMLIWRTTPPTTQEMLAAEYGFANHVLAVLQKEYNRLVPISPAQPGTPLPESFTLSQNYPNPFNPTTAIRIQLPYPARISLDIFDLQGRKIATLAGGKFPAGEHELTWKARHFASGIYLYRLEAVYRQAGILKHFRQTRKLTLLK